MAFVVSVIGGMNVGPFVSLILVCMKKMELEGAIKLK